MIIEYVCKNCKIKFDAEDWRKRKYCSKVCKGLHNKSGQFKKGHKWNQQAEEYRIKKIKENPSYGMLGKKHNDETKKKMSESSKNPYNYIDGGYCRKIDTDKCSICKVFKKRILIHHKDFNRKNNKDSNLISVCDKCHSKIHFPDGRIGKNIQR